LSFQCLRPSTALRAAGKKELVVAMEYFQIQIQKIQIQINFFFLISDTF
jgi:hypothetical protein